MISLRIEDRKDFTTKLLIGETFDTFLLSKATIATKTTVTLDGRINTSYYDSDERIDNDNKYAYWKECKELAFSRIKGKRLPLSFQFVMLANNENTSSFCQENTSCSPDQISGLFLNIAYDGTNISCVTGVALHTFTLDKTIEHLWDAYILDFFKKNAIHVTQLT